MFLSSSVVRRETLEKRKAADKTLLNFCLLLLCCSLPLPVNSCDAPPSPYARCSPVVPRCIGPLRPSSSSPTPFYFFLLIHSLLACVINDNTSYFFFFFSLLFALTFSLYTTNHKLNKCVLWAPFFFFFWWLSQHRPPPLLFFSFLFTLSDAPLPVSLTDTCECDASILLFSFLLCCSAFFFAIPEVASLHWRCAYTTFSHLSIYPLHKSNNNQDEREVKKKKRELN